MTTDKIFQAFYTDEVVRGFLHSHSYTGNPLACRAALATLDIFAQDNVITELHQSRELPKPCSRCRHPRCIISVIWA